MLLALLSGQRCQTLHCLFACSMKMSDSKCVFTVEVLLKQSRKGKHLASLSLKSKNCVLCQYQRSAFVGGKKSEGMNTNCYRTIRHHSTPLAKTLWPDDREMCSTEEALTLNSLVSTASSRAARNSGRFASRDRMELRDNVHPVLQERTSCK